MGSPILPEFKPSLTSEINMCIKRKVYGSNRLNIKGLIDTRTHTDTGKLIVVRYLSSRMKLTLLVHLTINNYHHNAIVLNSNNN